MVGHFQLAASKGLQKLGQDTVPRQTLFDLYFTSVSGGITIRCIRLRGQTICRYGVNSLLIFVEVSLPCQLSTRLTMKNSLQRHERRGGPERSEVHGEGKLHVRTLPRCVIRQ